MKSEQKIRDFTIRLIQILAWFEILWAVVFLAGIVFQWSGLTRQLATAFFGSGFCAVLVLAAIALLNVTANLNIISKAQMRTVAESEVLESKPGSFIRTLAVAGALITIVVLSLWFAERRLYNSKVLEMVSKIESISGMKLLDEAIDLIQTDGTIAELEKVREALSASIQTGARLSFIFPRKVKDVQIYYELTAWWYGNKNTKISEAGRMPEFVPRSSERKKWQKLIASEIDLFAVPSGDDLRVFRRIKNQNGEIILLIDTSRRSDYFRGSF